MAKHIIGSYCTEAEAISAVNKFQANGILAEDLTILTNHSVNTDKIETDTNVNVKIGGAEDESFWESIKRFFTDNEDADVNPYDQLLKLGVSTSDAATYQDDLVSGKIILVAENNAGVGTVPDASVSGFNVADDLTGNSLDSETEKVKRREEELQINKNKVQSGEVTIDKTVTDELQDVEVPVEKDEVHVERRAVRDYEESAQPINEDESIHIPIVEEEIEVKKKPVVKEEIVIDKSKNIDTEHVADTVKKEHVDVTDENGLNVEENPDTDEINRADINQRRFGS